MLVSLVVSLYTARVVIKVLGIDDYGIYNIVGGIIVLLSFVNNALMNATQRYISYEIGQDNKKGVNKVMCMSLQCHLLYALVFLLFSSTIGFWFVCTKLNIPVERMDAAYVVYLVSVLTFIISIFQAPYNAAIVAHERMSFYAFVSIFDVMFKLGIVYVLLVVVGDKLIIYSLLILLVTLSSLMLAIIYCYKKLEFSRPQIVKDKQLFKQFFGFTGWSMYNGCSYIGAQQGGNILINIYNGVAANGAFAIANQTTVIYGFVSNFQNAFNPQIVKSYSSGQYKEMFSLINRASYFSYYIFLIIAIPMILEMDYIMQLWLGEVPEYAANFCRLLIIYFLVDSFEAPLWMLIGATGRMKLYSVWQGTITLLNIPLSWMLLESGFSIYCVFIVRVFINVVTAFIRPFILKRLVPEFSLMKFGTLVMRHIVSLTFVLAIILYAILSHFNSLHPLLVIGISIILTAFTIGTIGLTKDDKFALSRIVKEKLKLSLE